MRQPKLAAYLIVICLAIFCLNLSVLIASAQASPSVRVLPSNVSISVGESFTLTIGVVDVQNLYGLEVALNWNPNVLRFSNADLRLGMESYSDGVLHEAPYSPPIFIAENNLTQTGGEYRLSATSMAPASSFSGSGNIVRITFEPISVGTSAIELTSELFDYPTEDRDPRVSLEIDHSEVDSFVTVKKSASTPEPPPTDTILPEIQVISPENQTYDKSSISLSFAVNEQFDWVGYSLDDGENSTLAGNFTLTNLSTGSHNVEIYANDTSGNMGVSEIIFFSVELRDVEPEPFPIVFLAVASVLIVMAASAVLFLQLRRRRRV